MCPKYFFLLLEALVLRLLEVKVLFGSKKVFFIIHFAVQSKLSLKISDHKLVKCHTGGGGGSEKCPKIVTYYLNGPYDHNELTPELSN